MLVLKINKEEYYIKDFTTASFKEISMEDETWYHIELYYLNYQCFYYYDKNKEVFEWFKKQIKEYKSK